MEGYVDQIALTKCYVLVPTVILNSNKLLLSPSLARRNIDGPYPVVPVDGNNLARIDQMRRTGVPNQEEFPRSIVIMNIRSDLLNNGPTATSMIQLNRILPEADVDPAILAKFNDMHLGAMDNNYLFTSPQNFPSSYYKLVGKIQPESIPQNFNENRNSTVNNARNIANLFQDYWDKGTGYKRFIFFHPNRHHTAAAKRIADALNDPNFSGTSEAICDLICKQFLGEKNIHDIKAKGSFDQRCNFAIMQITQGRFATISEYLTQVYLPAHPDAQVIPQVSNQ